MSKPGPKAQPAALKILHGNPGKRPIPKTVKAESIVPSCPKWLSPLARKEWRRATKELAKVGLMTRLDLALLASYCEAYAAVIECSQYIQGQGGLIAYLEGKVSSRSAIHLTTLRAAQTYIKAVATEFGMSPSSRSGIEIPEAPEKDKYLDW